MNFYKLCLVYTDPERAAIFYPLLLGSKPGELKLELAAKIGAIEPVVDGLEVIYCPLCHKL